MDSLNDIKAPGGRWTLENDAQLRSTLERLAESWSTSLDAACSSLAGLETQSAALTAQFSNIHHKINSIAGEKFVENRVQEDDVAFHKPQPAPVQTKEEREAALVADCAKAVARASSLLDTHFHQIQIRPADFDEDDDPTFMPDPVYEPRNKYAMRPLPLVIGSRAFVQSACAGLTAADRGEQSPSQHNTPEHNIVINLAHQPSPVRQPVGVLFNLFFTKASIERDVPAGDDEVAALEPQQQQGVVPPVPQMPAAAVPVQIGRPPATAVPAADSFKAPSDSSGLFAEEGDSSDDDLFSVARNQAKKSAAAASNEAASSNSANVPVTPVMPFGAPPGIQEELSQRLAAKSGQQQPNATSQQPGPSVQRIPPPNAPAPVIAASGNASAFKPPPPVVAAPVPSGLFGNEDSDEADIFTSTSSRPETTQAQPTSASATAAATTSSAAASAVTPSFTPAQPVPAPTGRSIFDDDDSEDDIFTSVPKVLTKVKPGTAATLTSAKSQHGAQAFSQPDKAVHSSSIAPAAATTTGRTPAAAAAAGRPQKSLFGDDGESSDEDIFGITSTKRVPSVDIFQRDNKPVVETAEPVASQPVVRPPPDKAQPQATDEAQPTRPIANETPAAQPDKLMSQSVTTYRADTSQKQVATPSREVPAQPQVASVESPVSRGNEASKTVNDATAADVQQNVAEHGTVKRPNKLPAAAVALQADLNSLFARKQNANTPESSPDRSDGPSDSPTPESTPRASAPSKGAPDVLHSVSKTRARIPANKRRPPSSVRKVTNSNNTSPAASAPIESTPSPPVPVVTAAPATTANQPSNAAEPASLAQSLQNAIWQTTAALPQQDPIEEPPPLEFDSPQRSVTENEKLSEPLDHSTAAGNDRGLGTAKLTSSAPLTEPPPLDFDSPERSVSQKQSEPEKGRDTTKPIFATPLTEPPPLDSDSPQRSVTEKPSEPLSQSIVNRPTAEKGRNDLGTVKPASSAPSTESPPVDSPPLPVVIESPPPITVDVAEQPEPEPTVKQMERASSPAQPQQPRAAQQHPSPAAVVKSAVDGLSDGVRAVGAVLGRDSAVLPTGGGGGPRSPRPQRKTDKPAESLFDSDSSDEDLFAAKGVSSSQLIQHKTVLDAVKDPGSKYLFASGSASSGEQRRPPAQPVAKQPAAKSLFSDDSDDDLFK